MTGRACKAGPIMAVYCWTLCLVIIAIAALFFIVAALIVEGPRSVVRDLRLILAETKDDYAYFWKHGAPPHEEVSR